MQTDLTYLNAFVADGHALNAKNAFYIADGDSLTRSGLEERIRSGFGAHFGACIEGYMPQLACYEHSTGSTGVIGFRGAVDDRLFLESYLDRPIETEIGAAIGSYVSRRRIVEIGQFVIDDRHAVVDFFKDLVPFLSGQGFEWVCFTATGKIRALLARMGFFGLPLAVADYRRIQHSSDDWGSYYDNDPLVTVGKLSDPHGHWCNADSIHSARSTAQGVAACHR